MPLASATGRPKEGQRRDLPKAHHRSAALFTALALFAVACSSNKSDTTAAGGSATTVAGGLNLDYSSLSGTLNGSGSTFQKAFDEDAIAGFEDVAPGVTVNYAGGGSGKGKTDLASQVTQWAGSDSAVKDADLPTFKGGAILYFPTVARAHHGVVQPVGCRRRSSSRPPPWPRSSQAR